MSVYTEAELGTRSLDEATAILENAQYLNEAESRYYAEMVPIRENSRLGKYLIRLEDFVEFATSNGYSDTSQALAEICSASEVDPQTIAFTVDEVNMLEDYQMEETVRDFKEAGAEVYAAPISENDMCYVIAESVADTMLEYGDEADFLLEAFINDDFDTIYNEGTLSSKIYEKVSGKKQMGAAVKEKATAISSKVSETVKQAATKSRKWIAKKISSFRTLIDKLSAKLSKYTGREQGIINKVIAKIKQAIEYLSKKLKSAIN